MLLKLEGQSFEVFDLERPDLFEDVLTVEVDNLDGAKSNFSFGVDTCNFGQNLTIMTF
jgi:hypothetical protein